MKPYAAKKKYKAAFRWPADDRTNRKCTKAHTEKKKRQNWDTSEGNLCFA